MAEEGEQLEMGLTVGERLKAARTAAKMSLEDVATATRIPRRHLEALEEGDQSRLPAPTYTVGFAKNYAAAVGLDRREIGEAMRAELGGSRPHSYQAEAFEPVDPSRSMPRWVVLGGLAAVILLVVLFSWRANRSLSEPDNLAAPMSIDEAANASASAPPPPSAATPIAINAVEPAWVSIKDGATVLKEGVMAPGETFQVPPTAVAPTLSTAKPEALNIRVGERVAPPLGPPGKRVTDVALRPDSLLAGPPRAPAAAAPPAAPKATSPAPKPKPKPKPKPPAPAPAPPPAPAEPVNNSAPAQ